jgi:ABC-2 type transport system permease protein
MKYAFLVAWREFTDNIRTKGFWIGICIFPIILYASFRVPIFLETKGTPTRHFVLVDQTGRFEKLITDQLDRAHQRRVLQALNEYAARYTLERDPAGPNTIAAATPVAAGAEAKPAPGVRSLAESNPLALESFLAQGGKEGYLRQLQPSLSSNAPVFVEPKRLFVRVALLPKLTGQSNLDAIVQELKPYLRGTVNYPTDQHKVSLYAAILIPADLPQQILRPDRPAPRPHGINPGIQYWSGNLADMRLRDEIERAVNGQIRREEFAARGLDINAVQQVERTYVPCSALNPKKESGAEKVGPEDIVRQWAPSAFVYLLWVAIFSIAQMLLNNTIEEKSNRIIEVLLSSVTPGELMLGKLMGITAVGLTMVGAWVTTMLVMVVWQTHAAFSLAAPVMTVLSSSYLIPAFALYFVLGFVLYAGIILSIGSVCNTLKEAQNYMGAITLVMMVPLMTMMFIPKDPNGTLATVLSWIPFYTPFVMMNRITADPPLRDLVGTLLMLLASDSLVLWMSGRIFRIGILRTGQPPKLIEMLRWIKG